MKPIRTIGQYLPSPKDPVNSDEITCVVQYMKFFAKTVTLFMLARPNET